MWLELIRLIAVLLHTRGLTWIPAWVLCCWVPRRLLGAFAGAGFSVSWGLGVWAPLCAFPPLLSFVIILVKHQVHPRHRLPGDAGRPSGWQRHRLLERNGNKMFGGDGWQVDRFNICWCSAVLFLFSAGSRGAHQDERRELSGGQTDSIRGVDPQQVVGCHVQVMVSMGGGKHTHLSTEGAETEDKHHEWVGNHN